MQRHTYHVLGWALLIALSGLVASCTALDATRDAPEEEVQRPYRIQVDMTPDKAEAERLLSQIHTWWEDVPAAERPAPLVDAGLQPDIVWRQPYYRVRLGQFATRDAAEEALAAVKTRFSSAFIARERMPAARR